MIWLNLQFAPLTFKRKCSSVFPLCASMWTINIMTLITDHKIFYRSVDIAQLGATCICVSNLVLTVHDTFFVSSPCVIYFSHFHDLYRSCSPDVKSFATDFRYTETKVDFGMVLGPWLRDAGTHTPTKYLLCNFDPSYICLTTVPLLVQLTLLLNLYEE